MKKTKNQKRYFTVAEVNKMIPQLEKIFQRLLQIFPQVHQIYSRLEEEGFAPYNKYFAIDPPGASFEIMDDLSTLKLLIASTQKEAKALLDTGCIIKDIETGLVDWYAKRDGRDVFLCWKYGEKEVGFWHEINKGYSGRQPL